MFLYHIGQAHKGISPCIAASQVHGKATSVPGDNLRGGMDDISNDSTETPPAGLVPHRHVPWDIAQKVSHELQDIVCDHGKFMIEFICGKFTRRQAFYAHISLQLRVILLAGLSEYSDKPASNATLSSRPTFPLKRCPQVSITRTTS